MAGDRTFMGIRGGAFCFAACNQDEIDTDSFQHTKSDLCSIQCNDSKYLTLNIDKFERKNLNESQLKSDSDCQLNIAFYRDTSVGSQIGRAVMLYAHNQNREMYAAVCNDRNEVVAKKVQKIERIINKDRHEAVFYMVEEEQDKYKFQSSLYPDKALGFDETDLCKLILRPYPDSNNQFDLVQIFR